MILKKRKYPDLQSLAVAFASGELSRDDWRLAMDNDTSRLVFVGYGPDGLGANEAEAYRDRKTDEATEWFRGSGYIDAVAACRVAGIPAEWV